MDLDALREAVEWVERLKPGDRVMHLGPDDLIGTMAAAARAVLDSEEADWCTVHRAAGGPIWCDVNESLRDGCNTCSMEPVYVVRRRLLAEERER